MTEYALPSDRAHDRLADLVGKAAAGGGRTDVDDAEGQWIATVIGATELAELEDLAAIGRCQIAKTEGALAPGVPYVEVRERIAALLERGRDMPET